MKIPNDVIAQLDHAGSWILCNVHTRDALGVAASVCACMSVVQKSGLTAARKQFGKTLFTLWEISVFPHTKGLLADPTPWIRDAKKWPKPKHVTFDELIATLQARHLLVDDEKKYRALFAPKTSLLDAQHLGHFHQRLGQKLMLEERVDPSDWWVKQKFSRDQSKLNETLYKWIQGAFLEKLFKERLNKKQTVVDIGCGTGFYARQMAKHAGKVIGVDPSREYIALAKKRAPKNAQFIVADVGAKDGLRSIPDNSADIVYMSDALLFYFVSPDPRMHPEVSVLFNDIKRILKPGGSFFSLEPHGVFWLQPWLGEESRPFTVLTEYQSKQFKVTPNPSECIQTFLKAGFSLKKMQELAPDPKFAKKDKRAYLFAKEFPLWWFFELTHDK